jgi:hypothetical protein
MAKQKKSVSSFLPTSAKSAPKAASIGNLAIQTSLYEIFDDFTEIITQELKTLKSRDD